MSLLETIGGGLMGIIGSKMTADAQTDANRANIAARAANQEKGLDALQSKTDFGITKRADDGGFDVNQVGGADAAKTRGITSFGDVKRATQANKLTDFNPKLPTVADAQGVIDRDISRTQRRFDRGVNTLLEAQRRKFDGVNNTGELPATIRALAEFSDANKFNREKNALGLFDKSMSNDLANVNARLGNLTTRAPAPAYTSGAPGVAAAQLVAQTPPATQIADLGGAAPFMGGQAILKDIQNQAATKENNALMRQLFSRQMGNQGDWYL